MNSTTQSSVKVEELMKKSAKTAVEICIRLLENDDIQGEEILKFWSTKLFQFYGLSECTNDILEFLLESIVKYLRKVLQNPQEEDENLKTKTIFGYINQWCNIYIWIKTNIEDFNLHSLSIFIENSLKTLELIFIHSTQRISNQCNQIFKESLQLYEIISSVVSENFNLFVCQVESCMDIIIKLTKLYCDIEKFISMLDVKSSVNLWKLLLRFYTENAEFYKNNIEIDFEWIKTPVILICDGIYQSIKTIYEKNIDEYSLDKLERVLKINSFRIKCLEKLAINFDHNYFHGCSEFLETIYLILNVPKKCKGTKKEEMIKQYLIVGLLNLLNYLYKNEIFMNKLLEDKDFETADKCANFCVIVIEIMKILCTKADSDTVFLYLDKKIMEKLFKNIPHSRELFIDKNKREEFIGLVASLYLQNYKTVKVMKLFENLLSNGILQNDFLLANICIDVCLVVVRFIHADNRYKFFKFWININEKFPKFADSLQSVYIEYLITSLYELLPNTYKSQFWSSYFSTEIENDNRILLTLAVNRIYDKTQQTIHKNKLQAELQRNIQTNFDKSIEKYYRVIELMKLLCDTDIDNTFLTNSLLQFWPLLSMDINLQKHGLFFRILLKCCARNIEIFNNNQIQTILTLIEKYVNVSKSSDNAILNLQLYDFLSDVIKMKTVFKDKANSIQILLRNNPENNLIEYLRLDNLSAKPSTSRDSNKYMANQFHVDFEHICKISNDNYETSPEKSIFPNKKIKLDGGREIVTEALRSAEKIQQYFKSEKANSMDINNMSQIIKIYKGIIDNC